MSRSSSDRPGGRRGRLLLPSTGIAVAAVVRAARLALAAGPALTFTLAVATLLSGALPVGAAWLLRLVVDSVAGTGGPADHGSVHVAAIALGLGAAALVTGVAPHVQQHLSAELGRRVTLAAQGELYGAVDRLPGLSRFETPDYQDRLRLAQQGGGSGPGQVIAAALRLSQALVMVAGFLGSLALLNELITLSVVIAGVPTLAAQLRISRARARMYAAITPMERRQSFFSSLLTEVRATAEAKLFGTGRWLRGRMLAELAASNAEQLRLGRREVRVQTGLAALAALISGAGLVWAVTQARAGELTAGDVTVFVAAVAGVQGGLGQAADEIAHAYESIQLFRHHLAVVDDAGDLPVPAAPVTPPRLSHGIEVDDVWFRYADDHPWTLRGVTMTIPAGAACALVGINGAGKSTLVKLLCRFYDPQHGSIRWDGVDLRQMHPAQLRQRLGVLLQEFMRYDLTAAENIALGDLDAADPVRIETAARRASVHHKLVSLPNGYATHLTRVYTSLADRDDPATGVVLSSGQWQRLALARTLLRTGRDLLVLDEPSAGLDAAAEYEIHTRLRRHRAGGTSLLISHRLNTVRDADVIVVLDDGRVTERGSHRELMFADGQYARLFRMQARGYHSDPELPEVINHDRAGHPDDGGGRPVVGAAPPGAGAGGGTEHAADSERR